MDEFEKWFKSQEERELTPFEWLELSWKEATKQKDVEIAHLKTIIENLEMSVRSFTDGNVDIAMRERERIVEYILGVAGRASCWYGNKLRELADRIKAE